MICIESRHFSFNRILLLAIGLWPYQRSKLARFQIILFHAVLMSFIMVQLTTFVTVKCTSDLVIRVLSSALFFITLVVKYNAFWINMNNIRCILEQLQNTCDDLKDENEIAIIKKYGSNAKHYTIGITLFSICCLFSLISLPMWPRVLDIVLPINGSRSRHSMLIATEYFMDQEAYSSLILLHTNAAFGMGAIMEVATGTMFIGCIKHFCGMFRIASYRIEQAMKIKIQQNVILRNDIAIVKGIICAVNIHRKAMKFSKFFISSFERSFFFLIMLGVCCLSLNLYRIMSFGNNVEDILIPLVYVLVILLYMLVGNYVAQEITDHNNYVFVTVYSVQWYTFSVQIQKMMLFLLQMGTKSFCLNLGGFFVASLRSAATMISSSISYFTVLYSTRH